VVLPEGNTSTRMYFNGTLRSWVHYCKSRTDPATQKEHRLVATGVLQIMREIAPITAEAFFPTN
jgi:thymidylate synthase (FAD)